MKKNKYIHVEEEHNIKAASVIVPELMRLYESRSVADVGCGLGTWLKVFLTNGVTDVVGYDGAHLNMNKVVIEKELIVISDLEKPIVANRKFDLVISLEVAEHISLQNAENFVNSLCGLGETVVFSAAIPQQGGQNHINEQWPEYWQKLFAKNGFTMHDVLRERFWDDERVDYWYRQNMFLATGPQSPFYSSENKKLRSLVHPDLLTIYHNLYKDALSGRSGTVQAAKALVKSIGGKG